MTDRLGPFALGMVHHADCLDALRLLPDGCVDAVVTDPPYGLGFMGRDWDAPGGCGDFPMRRTVEVNTVNTGVSRQGGRQRSCAAFARRQQRDAMAYGERMREWATESLRVARPGAHLLAFGGTRTFHRLACAIEDAGWEIRDCLMWLYGTGFPKSKNVAGGWGTALKPAWEPIILARKPLCGTVAQNVQAHGTGALNVDGCRIGRAESDRFEYGVSGDEAPSESPAHGAIGRHAYSAHDAGRWPANLVLDEEAAAMLDEQSGERDSTRSNGNDNNGVRGFGSFGVGGGTSNDYRDKGGASRFFYCAKASREERGEGNNHPTVKPLDLMRWLVRLVTPPGGIVLDPFSGSGTTGCAAKAEGFRFVGFDSDAHYCEIANARISATGERLGEVRPETAKANQQIGLLRRDERQSDSDGGQLRPEGDGKSAGEL